MTDKSAVSSELSRDLGLFQITMMGLGMMIGAGVFIGIGISIREAGSGGVMLTFALNGVIAILTAMSFAELSSAIPRAGGAYNFARIAFGRGTSFLGGWMEWFASSVAGSLYAVVFATYTLDFFLQLGLLNWTGLSADTPGRIAAVERCIAVAMATFFLYINYRGARETGRIGAFFTLGQMLFVGLIAVVGIGTAVLDPSRLANFKPFLPRGWSVLLMTMGFVYVAFEGFEVIAQTGDEAIHPKRNIPKAMLYSVAIAAVTYVLVSFATVVAVKVSAGDPPAWEWIGSFGKKGFGKAVEGLFFWKGLGGLLVTLAVIFSSTSALNATIYSGTRASYALGRDRLLPKAFSRISHKRKTPWVALLFTGVIVLAVAGFFPTEDVAASASIMFLFLFFLVNLCVIKVRYHMGDELTYGFLMPLFPAGPIVALICQAVLAAHLIEMSWLAWVIAPLWIAAGGTIYLLYSRSHAVTTAGDITIFEERKVATEAASPSAGQAYKIMVAVANPDSALELVRNTYKLCRAKNADVELLHMVPVPDQVPLTDAERYMLQGREGILETMLYLQPLFATSTTLRYCRNIARGIISAVREKKTNMLIMGWHGGGEHRTFSIGSTIDPVIERTPCDVVILKDCGGNRRFKRVLVPLAGGPDGAMALEIAGILADEEDGEIVAFTVTDEPAGKKAARFDVDAFVQANLERMVLPPHRISTRTAASDNVVEAIIAEATEYDLVVIGCTREPLLFQFARESIPETVARLCTNSLVMVKAGVGLRSWLKRWV